MCFLLDSGAPLSVLSFRSYKKIPKKFRPPLLPATQPLNMADGTSAMKVYGEIVVQAKVYDEVFEDRILVVETEQDGIWGQNFRQRFDCFSRPAKQIIHFNGKEYPWTTNKHHALGHSVHLIKPVSLPPGEEMLVPASMHRPFKNKERTMFEPSSYCAPMYGVLPGRLVSTQNRRKKSTMVPLFNATSEEVTIPQGAIVGHMFPADKDRQENFEVDKPSETWEFPMICTIHEKKEDVTSFVNGLVDECMSNALGKSTKLTDADVDAPKPKPTKHSCSPQCFSLAELEEAIPDHLDELYVKPSKNLIEDEKKKLAGVLIRTQDTFARNFKELGCTDRIEHCIDTGDARPIREPLRRHGPKKEKAISDFVHDGKERGTVEDSTSPWACSPVVAWKPDGRPRVCLDLRRVNKVTKMDSFPLPRFDDCVDSLHGSAYFCSLDLQSGYWQVPLRKQDREKTAFITKEGLFQMTVLPFGLCNAPATFERLMEEVLRGLQWSKCLIYLDDVLVYGRDFDTTLENLEIVLNKLSEADLRVTPKKCNFMQESLQFLGHKISASGVEPMEDKIGIVKDWPSLGTVPKKMLRTETKRFLGLVSYYRKFIKGMSQLAAPLYALLKAKSNLVWTEECEVSFNRLKAALCSAPVISYPNLETGGFVVDTDASDTGLGGTLSQLQEGEERLIGYYSRLLSDAERNYCITKREFLAVVRVIENFKPYLYGQHFLIRTDNAAVAHMLTLKDTNPQIQRWQLFLSQFTFDIEHRPGRRHVNADTMSRMLCGQCGRLEQPSSKKPRGNPRKWRNKTIQ